MDAGDLSMIVAGLFLSGALVGSVLMIDLNADNIHNCFSTSSSRYTEASATPVHSSFSRSSTIFGLAASILRILLCKCVISCVGNFDFCFLPLEGRTGSSLDFGEITLGATASSDEHPQACGGRHGSGCLPRYSTGQVSVWRIASFPGTSVEAFSG